MPTGEPVPRSLTKAHAHPGAEYVIYSFLRDQGANGNMRRGSDPWQHMGTLSDIAQARERARSLFRSSRYSRIELRKKFISEKTGAVIDVPLEVLDHGTDRDLRAIVLLLGMAMTCAMVALCLSLTL